MILIWYIIYIMLYIGSQVAWTGQRGRIPVKEVEAGDRILFGPYSGNDVRIENDKYRTSDYPDGGAR
jgi:co-chaperonin GroES (HSP10)